MGTPRNATQFHCSRLLLAYHIATVVLDVTACYGMFILDAACSVSAAIAGKDLSYILTCRLLLLMLQFPVQVLALIYVVMTSMT